jgi:hypothetical protein
LFIFKVMNKLPEKEMKRTSIFQMPVFTCEALSPPETMPGTGLGQVPGTSPQHTGK